ncbi:DUF4153 domain-containing protein [Microvirga flavescens]|uniref:DUF4153 domain-containing protein n=1 Tax=Microvirga flavescens TaxID=2249811 RepID=UPI001300847B|nr:DUF4153 domain-containing protein [Microvirga flavescens]
MIVSKSLSTVVRAALSGIGRFPLAALCGVIFCVLTILSDMLRDWEYKGYAPLLAVYGYFWFISMSLYAERARRPILVHGIGIGLFVALALFLHMTPDRMTSFAFLVPASFLLVFAAPFLGQRKADPDALWRDKVHLLGHVLFTIAISGVLFVGLVAIAASFEYLFDVGYMRRFYDKLFYLVGFGFAPLLALGGFSPSAQERNGDLPRPVLVLLNVSVVLLLTYALLLHAYIVKVLLSWSLPRGGVVHLVLWFGGICVAIYLLCAPLRNPALPVALLRRRFFWLLLAPLTLLSVAIGVRVQAYGVTEERYAILLFLFWLVLSVLLVMSGNTARARVLILGSLIAMLGAAALGPWGASNVSLWSQVSRLEVLLEKNGALVDGKLKTTSGLSAGDREQISSIAYYLERSRKMEKIQSWFPQPPENWRAGASAVFLNAIGAKPGSGRAVLVEGDRPGKNGRAFSVQGFDYVLTGGNTTRLEETSILAREGAARIRTALDTERLVLSATIDEVEAVTFDLKPLLQRVADKSGTSNDSALDAWDLDAQTPQVAARLRIRNFRAFYDPADGRFNPSYINFDLLIRRKDKF